ncbi:hypothetical protein Slin15195_G059780 [Septoria linicola]|uniref:Uncharacterized protein n=1 Tax=Septoria linicola TaxID=215465 RepID=A0A9Q9AQJ4_9PEZI|nr:hypothetical protein Slin14017_G075640 [Septoria linicola]USW52659.1 hypothetical protein Slin15195_G059780 [Septoria linicola]
MAGRHRSTESTNQSFPVSIAITTLVYNLLVASACAYLPDDPLYVGLSVQLYAWAGSALSVLGLAGILFKKPAWTTAFAHFLLLDTFVSAIVRLLILQFFFEAFYDHNVCTPLYDPTWNPRNFRHDIVTSVGYQKEYLWQSTHPRRCTAALGAVQVVLVGLLICLTVAQGSLAVTMRRFGKELEKVDNERRFGTVTMARTRSATDKPRRSPAPSRVADEKVEMNA